jgi:hypothetical protein
MNCLKTILNLLKISPTCFGVVTPSSGSALLVLAKVTVVKIVNYGTSVCDQFGLDVAAYISRSLLMCVCCTVHCASTEEPSLNIWLGFELTVTQWRWLRTSATLGNQWSGRMESAFRVLIKHCYAPYNCQNYGSHSQGSRLVFHTFHSLNLPVATGQLTPLFFVEDTHDFTET